MRGIVVIAAFACMVSGCGTLDPAPERSDTARQSVPNAVTRNSAPNEIPTSGELTERRLPTGTPSGTQVIDPNINPATARSYSATWEEDGYRYRSVMFPHVIDGCKVMIQSRRTLDYVGGSEGEFIEREGLDCNCDLMLDGMEFFFGQLNDEYKTPRMLAVCQNPGVDGATRQLEIMREGLKEDRNFDKMKNVEGF